MLLIQKFILPNGKSPFDQWFNTLGQNTQARIDARLDRLSLGNFGDTKSVGKGVYELRFFFESGHRIYFGKIEDRIILLLNGGSKNTQEKDIKTAQILWQRYRKEQEK